MKLDFNSGSIDFVLDAAIFVQPSTGLKLEDLALVPEDSFTRLDPLDRDVWLASESHSHHAKTSKFFSQDFGPPDLSSFDRDTFSTSRLIRVNAATGEILEHAKIPAFALWDMEYDWESTHCVGDKPFSGMHALSIVPSSDPAYDNVMFAAFQSSLYQDGSSPTDFGGSATRVHVYGLNSLNEEDERTSSTITYLKSFRYDTSRLTLKSYQKGASHFNALFGILAFNETSLLVAECEDLTSVGRMGQRIVNRIFYVELNGNETVDHCISLLNCDIAAPAKRIIWEREDGMQLDGMAWGPVLEDGRKSVALSFENDDKFGVHFELYALNSNEIEKVEFYNPIDTRDNVLKRRVAAVSVAAVILVVGVLAQFFWVRRLEKGPQYSTLATTEGDDHIKSSSMNFSNYALASAMLNSFLVGGLTFGYSGMVLMLRKEGVYAESCGCGSFW